MSVDISKKARRMKPHILYDLSKVKKDQPMKSIIIQRKYNLKGAEVRQIIHQLRLNGVPICSGPDGYYYPKDRIEAKHTINHLKSRAKSLFNVIIAMEEHFDKEDQQSLL